MKKKLIIVLLIILLIVLVVFFLNYFRYDNKLKRYLSKNDYYCINDICRTNKDDIRYDINVKNGTFKVLSVKYEFVMDETSYKYSVYKDSLVCDYTIDNFEKGLVVDNNFTYKEVCSKYLDDVNQYVNLYNELLENSKVSVEDFKK